MVAEQAAAVGWAAPLEAAGHLVHFHRQLDHQVAKEAVPRRSKVRPFNMTDMLNMEKKYDESESPQIIC